MSSEELYDYGSNYSDEYFGEISFISYSSFQPKYANIELIAYDMLHSNTPSEILSGKGYSDDILLFWDNLSSLYKGIIQDDSTYLDPAQFTANVVILENWVRSNYDVIIIPDAGYSNDGAAMLAMCSIAKYSYDYWFNNIDKWGIEEDSSVAQRKSIFRKVLNVIDVAATDAGGYLGEIEVKDGSVVWDHDYAFYSAREASRIRGMELGMQ